MIYNLNQDEAVHRQEHQPGQPDQSERVVAFELQEVGRAQPDALRADRTWGYRAWKRWVMSNAPPQEITSATQTQTW